MNLHLFLLKTVFIFNNLDSGTTAITNLELYDLTLGTDRITDNLQALYNFKEGSGSTVTDVSGVGTPLNLSISNLNSVVWTPKGLNVNNEVRIKSSSTASKIYNACTASNEITFEAWILPTDMTQRNVYARIMTLSNNDSHQRNLGIIQYGADYYSQLRTTSTDLNGSPASVSSGNIRKLTHIVYTRNSSGNVGIYVDGTRVVNETISGNFSNWDNAYYLYLASEVANGFYWEGTYYLVAIYSKAFNQSEVLQNYNFGVESDNLPLFIKNPVGGQNLNVGQTATFTAKAIGTAPLTYQWTKNNSNISGATSSTYTTPSVSLADNGAVYRCVATSADGSATSSPATITVSAPDSRITTDVIALYTFREGSGNTVNDVSGVGTPVNLIINTPNSVEWTTNGLQINSEANILSQSAATKLQSMCASTDKLTIEAWIKPANITQTGSARIVTYSIDQSNRNFLIGQNGDDFEGIVRSNTSSSNTTASTDGSATTDLTHVVIEFRTDQTLILFVNGVEKSRKSCTGDFSTWNTSYRLAIANEVLDSKPWLGTFNYLAIFNRSLTSEEILHNYNMGPYGLENINSPTELVVSTSEVGKVNVSWTDNATNEDGYQIERTLASPINWQLLTIVDQNQNTFLDETIGEGKNYIYRVRAANEFAGLFSDYSNEASVVTLLNKPVNLLGKADEVGVISLIWEDKSSNEDGYIIERGTGDPIVYSILATTNANAASYNDNTVQEGVIYSYKIKAFNSLLESGYSNSIMLRSKASFVLAPSGLKAQLDPVFGVPVLTWTDNAFNELGFVIERRSSNVGSVFSIIDTVDMDVNTYLDEKVLDSTSYIYRIYAFNEEYLSEYSNTEFIDVWTDINSQKEIPDEFGLLQNYPNPFNPTTNIAFNLPKSSKVRLKIYNLIGQEIMTLTDKNYSAGVFNITFDAKNLTAGIYIYSINAESEDGQKFVQSKKLVLLK